MNDFCPLINEMCNPNCVLLEQTISATGFGLTTHCSFAGAIKNSESLVISELKKLANKHR